MQLDIDITAFILLLYFYDQWNPLYLYLGRIIFNEENILLELMMCINDGF